MDSIKLHWKRPPSTYGSIYTAKVPPGLTFIVTLQQGFTNGSWLLYLDIQGKEMFTRRSHHATPRSAKKEAQAVYDLLLDVFKFKEATL
jgi:hypothetical protein